LATPDHSITHDLLSKVLGEYVTFKEKHKYEDILCSSSFNLMSRMDTFTFASSSEVKTAVNVKVWVI